MRQHNDTLEDKVRKLEQAVHEFIDEGHSIVDFRGLLISGRSLRRRRASGSSSHAALSGGINGFEVYRIVLDLAAISPSTLG